MTRFLTVLAAGTVLGTAYLAFPAIAAETVPLPSASAEAQSTDSILGLATAAGEAAAARRRSTLLLPHGCRSPHRLLHLGYSAQSLQWR